MSTKYLYILTFDDSDNKKLIGVFSTYINTVDGINNIIDKLGEENFMDKFGYTKEEIINLQDHIFKIKYISDKIIKRFYKVKGDVSKFDKKQINRLYEYEDLKDELSEGYYFKVKQILIDEV